MKNNFLIIDFSRNTPEFACLKVDFDAKTIESVNSSFQLREMEINKSTSPFLKKFFDKVFTPLPYSVILVFGPNNSSTYIEKFSGIRNDPKSAISKTEIDAFISESVWRMFDRNKQDCAKKFGVPITDTLLTEIKISGFHLDSKSLVNPINHFGKEFEAWAIQTFVKRSYYEKIVENLPKRAKIIGSYESGAVSAGLVSKIADQKNFLLAEVQREKVNIYWKDGQKIAFNDYFDWGEKNLGDVCSDIFGTPEEISLKIAESYAASEFSDDLKKKIDKKWNGEMTELVRGLKSAAIRLKTKNIYVDFPIFSNLNSLTPEKLFSKILLLGSGTEPLKYFGFSFCGKSPVNFAIAAAFIENYFSPKEDIDGTEYSKRTICLLNYFAKRRMKWLMP